MQLEFVQPFVQPFVKQNNMSMTSKTKPMMWNKLKQLIPTHFNELSFFEWKREWNKFYKKCALSNNFYLQHQNVYPQVIQKTATICSIMYTPIVMFSEHPQLDLTEIVRAEFANEVQYNQYAKLLFSTMEFDLAKDNQVSFISYLVNFFRIISLQKCSVILTKENKLDIDFRNLPPFERNQLQYIMNKDIKSKDLEFLGISFKSSEPELVIEANIVSNSSLQQLQHQNLFDTLWEFKWKVVIGDNCYDEAQFKELMKSKSDIIRKVNATDIIKKMKNKPHMNHGDLFRCYLLEKIKINEGKEFLENLNRSNSFKVPSMKTTLRPYQEKGFNWMLSNLLNGFGVILADEMGLGKTLQALTVTTYLLETKKAKNILILCPAILQITWKREISQHTRLSMNDIKIMSYETFASQRTADKIDYKYDLIILDEAQKIKNPSTKIWKSLQDIIVKYRLLISGTPVENNMTDLWAIMQVCFPGYLGNKTHFTKELAGSGNMANTDNLKKLVEPFILRRKKSDCAIELPDKVETIQMVDMTVEQAALYQKCLDMEMAEMNTQSTAVSRFKLATHLKMICNHPASFSKEIPMDITASNKCVFVKNFIEENPEEKIVIFTQFIEMGNILQKLLNAPFICGNDDLKTRHSKIDEFQNKSSQKVLIISLRTGGVGITLTKASYVIIFDLWWNPSVIDQAIDRTHRIGQQKTVYAYLLITKGTIEEKIYQMLQKKKMLSQDMMNIDEKWLTKMSNTEIKDLFMLA
jgi:SNF2 family DNA or RNA helicase